MHKRFSMMLTKLIINKMKYEDEQDIVHLFLGVKMKKRLILLVMCLLLWACQSPISHKDELKIVVASDIHYFLKDYYQECEWFAEDMLYADGKMTVYGDEIIQTFVEEVLELKPDIVVITGDLSFNGEKGSHEQLAKYLKEIERNGICVAVIPGNHDIDNIFAKGYGKDDYIDVDCVNAKDFKTIYKELGYDQAISKHDQSLSYRIDLNDAFSLILVDTNTHELTTGNAFDVGGKITDATLSWLTSQLQDVVKHHKRPIIAMHHNLAVHSDLLNQGYTIDDNEAIAALFQEYDVPFVLSGHIHCQNIHQIQGIYDIASSSLMVAPLQYGVIHLNQETMNYHCESLSILEDVNAYFDTVTYHKFFERIENIDDERVKNDVCDVIVRANRYYFAGIINDKKEEIQNMKGYQYIMSDENLDGFYKDYLLSMLNQEYSSTKIKIDL